jgi:hypothetical protein
MREATMTRHPITVEETNDLEVDDEDGYLYWQGERVLTEIVLRLDKTANRAVIIAAASTLGIFLLTALQSLGVLPSGGAQKVQVEVIVTPGQPPAVKRP